MIVKVQRSLYPRDSSVLIYDKPKKIYYETQDPKAVMAIVLKELEKKI